jgi:hypothetical protein
VAWHEAYDDPSSALSARLQLVQAHLAAAIDRAPAGPVRLVSLCAGQGHDVIGVLDDHPRRGDVSAVLVEADTDNAAAARELATGAGLAQVEVRRADASRVASFADALPAGVLLLCGIFGNVSEPDIEHTIAAAATFVTPGATVIWTRHRRPPDRTPRFRALFTAAGFEEIAFGSPETAPQIGVGAARFRGTATPAPAVWPEEPLFTFRPQART